MMEKKMRVAEMIVNVSGPLAGGFQDWPANIQDEIYKALERQSERAGASFTIVGSKCDRDEDTGWYLHVVATTEYTLQ